MKTISVKTEQTGTRTGDPQMLHTASKQIDRRRILTIVLLCVWGLFFLGDILYFAVAGEKLINSDSASEMILARLLNETRSFLLTDQWYYSTELRVLNTQIIYRLFLWLFPDNWHVARLMSITVFLLILSVSSYFLFYELDGKHNVYGIMAAIIIVSPLGQWYGWNVIYDSYYVPHIAISIAELAIVIHISRRKWGIDAVTALAAGCILAFLSGLGGTRQLMITYAPLAAASVALLFLKSDLLPRGMKIKNLISVFTIDVSAAVGYLVNSRVLLKTYYFEDMEGELWSDFSLSEVVRNLGELIGLYGWQSDVKLVSLYSVSNVACLFLVALIVVCTVVLIKMVPKLRLEELLLLGYGLSSFAVLLLIYSQCNRSNRSYWVPFLPISLFLVILLARKAEINRALSGGCAAVILSLLFCSIAVMQNPYPREPLVPADTDIVDVAKWLEECGLTRGYATFWQANIITELTDGKTDMYCITSFKTFEGNKWLQSKEFVSNPQRKDVFLLFTANEWDAAKNEYDDLMDHLIYGTENYYIAFYDDISQFTAE